MPPASRPRASRVARSACARARRRGRRSGRGRRRSTRMRRGAAASRSLRRVPGGLALVPWCSRSARDRSTRRRRPPAARSGAEEGAGEQRGGGAERRKGKSRTQDGTWYRLCTTTEGGKRSGAPARPGRGRPRRSPPRPGSTPWPPSGRARCAARGPRRAGSAGAPRPSGLPERPERARPRGVVHGEGDLEHAAGGEEGGRRPRRPAGATSDRRRRWSGRAWGPRLLEWPGRYSTW